MGRLLYLIVLMFLGVFIACGPNWRKPKTNYNPPPPIKAWVCIDVPDAQFEAVEKSVTEWNRSIGVWKHLIPVREKFSPGCSYWIHEVKLPANHEPTVLAWTNEIGGYEISLIKGRYEFDTLGIMMHELGHAFGAQHVPGTLMNATWNRHYFTCPDLATVSQVAAWNHINLDLLTWCSQ